MKKDEGKIYFVSAPGRIKIGFTTNPEQRLAQLRRTDMEKLEVIATVDGFKWVENKLHSLLNIHRVKGEWFLDCPDVRAVVNDFISGKLTFEKEYERQPFPCFDIFAQRRLTLDAAVKESLWIADEIGKRIERREDISDLARQALFLATHIIGPAINGR